MKLLDIYWTREIIVTNAFRHPVIPIGSSGSLDFGTGTFTLPDLADFEMYLHEVSGAWLLEQFGKGFFLRLDADQDAVNDYTLSRSEAEDAEQPEGKTTETKLPDGDLLDTLTPDGEADGWKKYWLGDTPETAKEDGQVLVYLLFNEETNEIDAFRTSREMIEAGDEDIDVSLYLYRDSRSDRMGEEKYDVMFFDTPEGEKSLVKVITDVLEDRELEVPRGLRIELRSFYLDGADYPVYSLTDHFFAMCDGTDGTVSMFDGFYRASVDADTFESDYTKVEGILDGDLNVTIKKDQPIWPEWTGENAAEDIQGNAYTRTDDEWKLTGETI